MTAVILLVILAIIVAGLAAFVFFVPYIWDYITWPWRDDKPISWTDPRWRIEQ
jgi:hypothetical protein